MSLGNIEQDKYYPFNMISTLQSEVDFFDYNQID